MLDTPITKEEIVKVIQSLSTGKAPGPNGFTVEFYRACVDEQTLPTRIPVGYFKQFNVLCNRFMWNDKCPRLKLKRLQKPIDSGDLGVPNLSLFHYAFSLRHMIHWALPPERAPPWFDLEGYLCRPLTSVHLITTKLPSKYLTHLVVSFLQYVWKKVAAIL